MALLLRAAGAARRGRDPAATLGPCGGGRGGGGAPGPRGGAGGGVEMAEEIGEEFEKATRYELRDEDIERARLLLGIDVASPQREHISVATPDAIRNWALG